MVDLVRPVVAFDAAEHYRGRGWSGTIPLPAAGKWPPPAGFTGEGGRYPTPADIAGWRACGYGTKDPATGGRLHHGAANVALRLPPSIAGFDVDHYANKRGGQTLAVLEARLGPLPPTWISTSRSDGVSGIRFYRVRGTTAEWPNQVGPDIEIIRHGHRYALVAPSTHPDGGTYRWIRPDGTDAPPGEFPGTGELPELPDRWVTYLTGRQADGQPVEGHARPGSRSGRRAADAAARAWLDGLPGGDPCAYVARLRAEALESARRVNGCAHDNVRGDVLAMLRAGETGHPGVPGALAHVAAVFIATTSNRSAPAAAAAEFDQLVLGGARLVLAGPGERSGRGCDCPAEPLNPVGPAGLDIVTAADIAISRVVYAWEGRIPRGATTLMPGEEGIGKTTVGIRLIADLTRGTLAGEHYGTARDALVLAAEDGLADVFVPRLREAGADLTRVHIVRARVAADGGRHELIIPRDLETLSVAVRHFDVALVWIDSLVTTLPDELKSISYKDTAKVLRRLGAWAEEERIAVVAPWHLNKAAGNETAIRIMDSRAFRTAVRAMLLVVADPEAPEGGPPQGLVALDKANGSTLAVPALRYRIRQVHYVVPEVDAETGQIRDVSASCGVVDWIGQVDNGLALARSFLAPAMTRGDDPKVWLRDYLTERGLTLRQKIIEDGAQEGFSAKQLQRAASSLGVAYVDMTLTRKGKPPLPRKGWRLPGAVEDTVQDTSCLTRANVPDVLNGALGRFPMSLTSQVSGVGDVQDVQDYMEKLSSTLSPMPEDRL